MSQNRIISFATGSIWRWETDRNNLLDYIKKLDVSGVELTLARNEDLFEIDLSKDMIKWLKSLKYVTIHTPFDLIINSSTDEIIKKLDKTYEIYKKIGAKNVIIHPNDLPEGEILDRYKMNISLENLIPKKGYTIEKLDKILKSNPEFSICIDVSHAYLWSKDETKKLIKKFKDKISQIHFSGTFKRKDHQSLRNVSKEFIKSIQPIKKINVPIVIEEDMKIKSLKYVKEEIELIKSLLK